VTVCRASVEIRRQDRLRHASISALFFPQGKQDEDDAERCRNRRGGEAGGRNFSARLKTFFEVRSKPDQKEKKSHADQYQADRFLVIARNPHLR
jgi:hypothetical protein